MKDVSLCVKMSFLRRQGVHHYLGGTIILDWSTLFDECLFVTSDLSRSRLIVLRQRTYSVCEGGI